jgi:hypothetical protein
MVMETTVPQGKVKLPAREILAQATVIVQSTKKPRKTMPPTVQQSLRQAIDARQRCTAWFMGKRGDDKLVGEDESNIRHSYFIKVLQDAWALLTPCFETAKAKASSPSNSRAHPDISRLNNQFEVLWAKDVDNRDLAEHAESVNPQG